MAINVCITGAAGQIAYSLIPMVCKGDVFGKDQHIKLSLLDIEPMMGVLNGVKMEVMDCAYPLVDDVSCDYDPNLAFKGVDAVFLVGAMPRKQGMERKDLLSANVKIFKEQGSALDQHAKKDVKIVVVGNPANTNAGICCKFAPSIPRKNITCLTRLDQNRAQAQIAAKAGVPISAVNGVIIWGNHSSTQFPDASHATVDIGRDTKKVSDVIDEAFLKEEVIKTVQQRGAAVIAARKLSSAMSAAKASADHMRDWWCGTNGRWVSMGVFYEGGYTQIPVDVVYSVPVTIDAKKNWTPVEGLALDAFAVEKMKATAKELKEEKQLADEVTGSVAQQTKGGH